MRKIVGIGALMLALVSPRVPVAAQATRTLADTFSGPGTVRSITVVGQGSVRVAPERLRFVLRLLPRFQPGSPAAPPGMLSGLSLQDAASRVVEALRKAGVADARVEIPLGNSIDTNVTPVILGTVDHPTRERLESLARTTIANVPQSAATDLSGFQLNGVYSVADCRDAERRAERLAFERAKEVAQNDADAAGVTLGAVLTIDHRYGNPSNPCASQALNAYGPFPRGSDGASVFGELLVEISANATVTFAMR